MREIDESSEEQLGAAPWRARTTRSSTGHGPIVGEMDGGGRVEQAVVTTEPQIHEIMLHEFWTKSGTNYVFDPKPAPQFLASLTPIQRSILIQYPKEASSPGRLVAFITLRGPRTDHPMYADYVDGTRQVVIANADFTVFHCSKPGNRVTLVMHTEHLCVNKHNDKSANFFRGLPASALSTTSGGSRQRPRYFLAARPDKFTHIQIYNSILAASGQSIMGGNYLHGMVNAQGCWMLFRNFNWPRGKAKELFRIYIDRLREAGSPSAETSARADIAALGYDAPQASGVGAGTMSSSWDKFNRWDRNYAYGFFFDRVVGLKFLHTHCRTWEDSPGVRAKVDTAHLYNTHGDVFEKQFPEAERFPKGQPNGNRFHDWFLKNNPNLKRGRHGTDVPPPPTLWQPNVLGFQTAKGCAGQGAASTWADLFFFFLPEGLSLNSALGDVYVPLT